MGLLDTAALFGTVALALPIALLGIEFLAGGRIEGAAFLAVAAGLVVGQHYALPSIKRRLAGSAVDAVTGDRDEETYND